MRLLHSKHQKLILQCYPPGKAPDKKPNPLELSYLLYYASTRRVKLEKVIEFLKAKTKMDVRGRKPGNLAVTLSIILALIDKCYENLNVFAPQVCNILNMILAVEELPLCKALVATFGTLCSKLDNGLFAGDKAFVDCFSKLTLDMIALGKARLLVQSTNKREWEMFSLLTCRHVFACLSFNRQMSHKFIPLCVSLLALTVQRSFSHEKLSARLKSNLNVEHGNEKFLSRTSTIKSAAQTKHIMENFEDDNLMDEDLGEEALLGLKTLFNTTLPNQISEATKLIVEYDFSTQGPDHSVAWGSTLLETCASYTPVQLRFQTLVTLITTLSKISENPAELSREYSRMKHYSRYILGLVSSGFNMIGLSISDILLQLLSLQANVYLKLSDFLTADEVSDLSAIYSECICNLSSHIYYFDQVSDSIEGILFQIDSTLATNDGHSTERVFPLVKNSLSMITVILELLSVRSSAITRNHATFENWEISFNLLDFTKAYPRISASAPREEITLVQKYYLRTLHTFLIKEMSQSQSKSADSNGQDESLQYMSPNYNNYFEDRDNTLSHFIATCEKYYEDIFFDKSVAAHLAKVLEALSSVMGINFAYTFLPHFDRWQLQQAPTSLASISRDICAYDLLANCISCINDNYQNLLKQDISELTLSKAVFEDIRGREQLGVWLLDQRDPDSSKIMKVLHSQVSLATVEEFFADTPLEKYFSAPSHVVLDFGRGQSKETLKLHNGDIYNDARESLKDSPNGNRSILGLGNANDISFIYSELLDGVHKGKNAADDMNTSQITQDTLLTKTTLGNESNGHRYAFTPRVGDLKHSVKGTAQDSDNFMFSSARQESPHWSVLQKQIHTTDVHSILDGLKIEDDNQIVV